MFPTMYRRLAFIAALMLLGVGVASAATVPWSRFPLAPSSPASIAGSAPSYQAPESFLYNFKGVPDGSFAIGQLIDDGCGSLYGTTESGGLVYPSGNTTGGGTVFKLTRTERGYIEHVIYRFGESGSTEGFGPAGSNSLAIDRTGALYGTTNVGGSSEGSAACGPAGCGNIFKLTPTANGYTETILHNF